MTTITITNNMNYLDIFPNDIIEKIISYRTDDIDSDILKIEMKLIEYIDKLYDDFHYNIIESDGDSDSESVNSDNTIIYSYDNIIYSMEDFILNPSGFEKVCIVIKHKFIVLDNIILISDVLINPTNLDILIAINTLYKNGVTFLDCALEDINIPLFDIMVSQFANHIYLEDYDVINNFRISKKDIIIGEVPIKRKGITFIDPWLGS